MLSRRSLLGGLIAAPAIIPVHNLMKLPRMPLRQGVWFRLNGVMFPLDAVLYDMKLGQLHLLNPNLMFYMGEL